MATVTTDNDNLVDIDTEEVITFTPNTPADDELVVTDSAAAEGHEPRYEVPVKPEDPNVAIMQKLRDISEGGNLNKVKSDGSTASYYELPEGATELQHLISFKDLNAQMGEIFRAVYRYGEVAHSARIRDAKKIKYYIEAEIERLLLYGDK